MSRTTVREHWVFAAKPATIAGTIVATIFFARYHSNAIAQTRPDAGTASATASSPYPMAVPGLETSVRDPHDDRNWSLTTRTTRNNLSIIAAANGGQLAVSFERRFAVGSDAPQTCAALLAAEVRTQGSTHRLRAETATAFRSVPFNADRAFQLAAGGFAVEYTCIDAGGSPWLASAMAYERAGLTLTDCTAMAVRLAEAVQTPATRSDGSLRLTHSALTLRAQSTDGVWLFSANSEGFPIVSDAISTRAGDSGGATITIARQPGRCADAWSGLRPWLTDEGVRTDRPGYVPAIFGARIRRVTVGERLREVYCAQPSPNEAVIASAVFIHDDADAMLHVGEFLRRVEQALPTVPTASTRTSSARPGGAQRSRDAGTN